MSTARRRMETGKGIGPQPPPTPDHVHTEFLNKAGPTILTTLSPQRWNSRYGNASYGFPGMALNSQLRTKKPGEACPDNASIYAESRYPCTRLVWVRDETSSVYFQSSPPPRAVAIILSTRNLKMSSSQYPLDVKSWNEDISANRIRNRKNGWVPMEGVMAALTSF